MPHPPQAYPERRSKEKEEEEKVFTSLGRGRGSGRGRAFHIIIIIILLLLPFLQMLGKIGLVLVVGFLGWVYQTAQPPPPAICGSPNGPPITAKRIKLRDGRFLAYKESGVPKEIAAHKIILIHGYSDSRDSAIPASSVRILTWALLSGIIKSH
ncbi:hypothetical protein ACLOJK_031334 [Asimina triloba]